MALPGICRYCGLDREQHKSAPTYWHVFEEGPCPECASLRRIRGHKRVKSDACFNAQHIE